MLSSALLSLLAVVPLSIAAPAPAPAVFNVGATGGNATSPYQYGIIHEDINHSGDGGIYAELIMNRAFQADNLSTATLSPWYSPSGAALHLTQGGTPLSKALPISLQVSAKNGSTVSFANPGYWGIDVQPYEYQGQFYVRGPYSGNFVASLVSDLTGEVYASANIAAKSVKGSWTHLTYTLTPSAASPTANNSLVISFDGAAATAGSLNFNLISLFPPTYNNSPNGNRMDLMQALGDLTPSFIRMPGGNNMEGNGPLVGSPAWPWNLTIGPLIDRPGHMGAWGYYDTDGLGLNEYFQWAKDLNMEPVLAVADGHYIDFEVVACGAALAPWIQSAIDEIHYVMDPVSTAAGALRASHGYPAPWPLHYVEIGNEDNLFNGTASYVNCRWQEFHDAIAAEFPNLKLIADTQYIDVAPGELSDYHVYSTPDGLVEQYNYFDQNATDTQTMIGEYACVDPNAPNGVNWNAPLFPHPFWIGTVGEAVFLLGAERNAGKIFGAAYAPILANINSEQWKTNLIYFSAKISQDLLTTSWYLIELFSGTRFTTTRPVTTTAPTGPLYWVAGENEDSGAWVFKAAVYNSTSNYTSGAAGNVPVTVNFPNVHPGTQANLTVLTAPSGPYAYSQLGAPVVVTTTTILRANVQGGYTFTLPDLSIAVLATQPAHGPGGPWWGWGAGWGGFGGWGGCKGGQQWGGYPWRGPGNGC